MANLFFTLPPFFFAVPIPWTKDGAKIGGIKRYKIIPFESIEINDVFEFTIAPNGRFIRIRLHEILDFDREGIFDDGFGNGNRKWRGSATTLFPHKIQNVIGEGIFISGKFFGFLDMNEEVWYFHEPIEKQQGMCLFYTNKEIAPCPTSSNFKFLETYVPCRLSKVKKPKIEGWPKESWIGPLAGDVNHPVCIINPVVDYYLWDHLYKKHGSGAEGFVQTILDELQNALSEFYPSYKFGLFGNGPQFIFAKPTFLKEPKRFNFSAFFNYTDDFAEFQNFDWGSNCLNALLTHRHHVAYPGIGPFRGICHQGLEKDGKLKHLNVFGINFGNGTGHIKSMEALKHIIKHEVGHNLGANHDPADFPTVMQDGMDPEKGDQPNFPLLEKSVADITFLLENIADIPEKETNECAYTNCFVPRYEACKKTGNCV